MHTTQQQTSQIKSNIISESQQAEELAEYPAPLYAITSQTLQTTRACPSTMELAENPAVSYSAPFYHHYDQRISALLYNIDYIIGTVGDDEVDFFLKNQSHTYEIAKHWSSPTAAAYPISWAIRKLILKNADLAKIQTILSSVAQMNPEKSKRILEELPDYYLKNFKDPNHTLDLSHSFAQNYEESDEFFSAKSYL